MTYNGAGQMTHQVAGSVTADFRYAGADQNEVIQQSDSGSPTMNYYWGASNQAGTPTLEEVTGPFTQYWDNDAAGQPIDFVQDGKPFFIIYDGVGLGIGTILPTGVQNGGNIPYDPYGAFQSDFATSSGSGSSAKNQAKGATKNKVQPMAAGSGSQTPWTTIGVGDGPVHWWKYGARWNDTYTGTWTTIDPITRLNDPNRANPYTYAGDNPVDTSDPAGTCGVSDIFGAAVGGLSLFDTAEAGMSFLDFAAEGATGLLALNPASDILLGTVGLAVGGAALYCLLDDD